MDKEIKTFGQAAVSGEGEVVRRLREDIAGGKHWYIALLEAVGRWNLTEESYNGCEYHYLIADEAFDWLLLAQRLLDELGPLVPEDEAMALLFRGKAPIELPREEFRRLIGEAKYCAHLNYFYGVTVEEALLLAAEEEARKEQLASAFNENGGPREEAYVRIYDASVDELLKKFRKDKGYPRRKSMGLGELKEFTYWLFHYRLNSCDKARIASDTKKALDELERQRGSGGCGGQSPLL